tara:strand:- start:1 stop:492 length:492 start_codon:yes stop_codon:yes gene_type:complete
MKICCRCGVEKERSEYHKKTSSKDGLDNRCKDCKRDYNKTWTNENREHVRKYNREFVQKQRRNPKKRMYKNLMARASKFKQRKGFKITKSYNSILGCSRDYLAEYIESKFDENMNWENYATYWELDHEIELFRIKDEEDYELINHFTNLRPLEKIKNRMRNYE